LIEKLTFWQSLIEKSFKIIKEIPPEKKHHTETEEEVEHSKTEIIEDD
jgi:hypothetical protein